MPGAESAAGAILTGQTDRRAFEEERTESELFGVMPFVRSAVLKNFTAVFDDDPFDLRLKIKIRGHARQAVDDGGKHLFRNRGGCSRAGVVRLKDRGRFFELRQFAGFCLLDRFYFLKRHFEPELEFGFKRDGIIIC